MNDIILDLCGGSGSWAKPYKDAGYDVRLITLPDNDIMNYNPPSEVYGILAAPPCTEFSPANETLKKGYREKGIKKNRNLDEGFILVKRCLEIIENCHCVFWALENPTGYLRQYLGKPELTFQLN